MKELCDDHEQIVDGGCRHSSHVRAFSEMAPRKSIKKPLSSTTRSLALVVFFLSFAQNSKSAEVADVVATVRINFDCSAFKRESDGKWIATKRSNIAGSVDGPEPVYPGLNLDMMRPNGLNLVDALHKKCSR
jgi:hypothetical protein